MKRIYTVEIEVEQTDAGHHASQYMGEFLDIALHYPDWDSIKIVDCVITAAVEVEE
jgi:hypothetical protein